MELKDWHYDLIDDVMDNFDFEKVHKAMVALDWKWALDDGTFKVPVEFIIRKQARKMMKKTIREAIEKRHVNGFTLATGGLEVYYNDSDKYLELKFVLTNWNAYVDDDGSIMSA